MFSWFAYHGVPQGVQTKGQFWQAFLYRILGSGKIPECPKHPIFCQADPSPLAHTKSKPLASTIDSMADYRLPFYGPTLPQVKRSSVSLAAQGIRRSLKSLTTHEISDSVKAFREGIYWHRAARSRQSATSRALA
jgi:hypothetical protein